MARKNENAFYIKISGRVTGVGFRWSVLEKAGNLPSLSGYVRNIGYGEVEAFVQGPTEEVDALISYLRSGPPLARVDTLSISEAPMDKSIRRFEIR